MSAMVERVARALLQKLIVLPEYTDVVVFFDDQTLLVEAIFEDERFRIDCGELARAAIQALREPTEEMKAFVVPAGTEFPLRAFWEGMIDEALK